MSRACTELPETVLTGITPKETEIERRQIAVQSFLAGGEEGGRGVARDLMMEAVVFRPSPAAVWTLEL